MPVNPTPTSDSPATVARLSVKAAGLRQFPERERLLELLASVGYVTRQSLAHANIQHQETIDSALAAGHIEKLTSTSGVTWFKITPPGRTELAAIFQRRTEEAQKAAAGEPQP